MGRMYQLRCEILFWKLFRTHSAAYAFGFLFLMYSSTIESTSRQTRCARRLIRGVMCISSIFGGPWKSECKIPSNCYVIVMNAYTLLRCPSLVTMMIRRPEKDSLAPRPGGRTERGGGTAEDNTGLAGEPTRHSGKRPPLGDNYFVEENSDARRSSVYCSHRATADMARRLSRRVAPSCVGVNNPSRLCAFYYEKNTVLRKHFVAYTTLRK